MNLRDAYANYRDLSRKAGDIARQLGFVGLGLVWLFRIQTEDDVRIPDSLRTAGFLLVAALAVDLVQYIVSTYLWHRFAHSKERKLQAQEPSLSGDYRDHEFEAPRNINRPADFLLWAKLAFTVAGYIPLLRFLLDETY